MEVFVNHLFSKTLRCPASLCRLCVSFCFKHLNIVLANSTYTLRLVNTRSAITKSWKTKVQCSLPEPPICEKCWEKGFHICLVLATIASTMASLWALLQVFLPSLAPLLVWKRSKKCTENLLLAISCTFIFLFSSSSQPIKLLDELGLANSFDLRAARDTKLAVWFQRNKLEKGLRTVLFIPELVATWSNSDFRDSKNRKRWKKTNGPSSHINFCETESCQWYAARNGVQTPK